MPPRSRAIPDRGARARPTEDARTGCCIRQSRAQDFGERTIAFPPPSSSLPGPSRPRRFGDRSFCRAGGDGTALFLDHPFFGTLLFRLKPIETTSVATMATDGVSLFYNPKFAKGLAPEELIGVLAHEVMHPALHHDTRRGDRDQKLWNQACDYAINPLLLDAARIFGDSMVRHQ